MKFWEEKTEDKNLIIIKDWNFLKEIGKKKYPRLENCEDTDLKIKEDKLNR